MPGVAAPNLVLSKETLSNGKDSKKKRERERERKKKRGTGKKDVLGPLKGALFKLPSFCPLQGTPPVSQRKGHTPFLG